MSTTEPLSWKERIAEQLVQNIREHPEELRYAMNELARRAEDQDLMALLSSIRVRIRARERRY